MPLTEEEKKKIEEEEYRKNLQAQNNHKTDVVNPRKGKNKMLLGIGLMILGIVIMSSASADGKEASGFVIFLGVMSLFTGLVFIIIGKFVHWYHWK